MGWLKDQWDRVEKEVKRSGRKVEKETKRAGYWVDDHKEELAAAAALALTAGGAAGVGPLAGLGGSVTGAGAGMSANALLNLGATGLSAGASLYGSKKQAEAADRAAQMAAEGQASAAQLQRLSEQEQLAFQKQMYEEGIARQQPFYDIGLNALQQYADLPAADIGFDYTPFDPSSVDVTADPSYQFRLDQSNKAIERALAGMAGGAASGRGLKEATRWAQDFASNEYANAYNRALAENQLQYGQAVDKYNRELGAYTQQANQLANLAGIGQTSTGQLQSLGSQYAQSATNLMGQTSQNLANLAIAGGQNQANAQIAAANARMSGLQGVGSAITGGLNQYFAQQQQQNTLNALQNLMPQQNAMVQQQQPLYATDPTLGRDAYQRYNTMPQITLP